MGLRFKRSVKICKGVKINFGKTGISTTFGTKGLHYTIHSNGRKTVSAGIPGTGLSYVSSFGGGHNRKKSSGRRLTSNQSNTAAANLKAQQQAQIQQQKEIEYAQNCKMVDDYNELIDQIKSIHEECSDPVDWVALKDRPAPYDKTYMGPFETKARQALNNAKPSLLGRFIPATDKKRIENLEEAVDEARKKDQQMYSDWENLNILAGQVLNGDIDSYFFVVSEMHPFDEILEYGSDFDIGTDISDLMEVEFHAKTAKVVPNYALSMTQTGKLSSKAMTKTMYYNIVQDYICSCVLRIAREMFALLPINRVVIHAMDTIEDIDGKQKDETVLSTLIYREQLTGVNFDIIDPSDMIDSFQSNVNFKKTQGFKPVPRVEF